MNKWAKIIMLFGIFLSFAGATWTLFSGEPVITGFYDRDHLPPKPPFWTNHFFSGSTTVAGIILVLSGFVLLIISIFRRSRSKKDSTEASIAS